jgi:hypothetical protein
MSLTTVHSWIAFSVFVGLAATGCSTIKSELYSTNGCSEDRTTKHLHGAPITVDVPSHVRIEIVEKKYFEIQQVPDPATPVPPGLPPATKSMMIFRPDLRCTRAVNYDLITMKELFTVDLKRPLSGTIDYTLGFDAKTQYFNALKTKTVDTTITDVAALIQTVIATTPTLASLGKIKLTGTTVPPPGTTDIIEIPGVIAVELFSINDPQLNEKVQAFLETYLNQCTPPCPPAVAAVEPPLGPTPACARWAPARRGEP